MKKILEGNFYLERFTGKGGWTYVPLQKQQFTGVKSFGMLKVWGKIDEQSFEEKHLMPKGDGTLFLPVAKDIRKEIKKEAGDLVYLELFVPESPSSTPQDLIDCLKDDPGKLESWERLSQAEQKEWVDYIYETQSLNLQTKRILKLLQQLRID